MAPFDSEVQSSALCAIVSGADHLFGLAVFHEDRRALRICEYHEDSHASRTEALLLQLQPKSCCVQLSDPEDAKKLRRVAESCGVSLTEVKPADLKQVDVEQDLLKLLEDAAECGLGRHLEEQRRKQGMRAVAVLLGHHALLSEPANFGACTLGLYPLTSFMYLDKAAFSALNVLPRPEESLRSSTSLLGFLNRCRSTLGTRRLRQWLTQPLTSPEDIARRHDVVEALCSAEELLRQLEGQLRHVPDVEKMAARFHCTGTTSKAAKASIEDMVMIYQCVLSAESMLTSLGTYEGVHREVLSSSITEPLRACIVDFQNYRALVESTIDLKQAQQRNYCISMNFDPSLQQLAAQRDQVRRQMEVVREAVDNTLGLTAAANHQAVSLTECPEGQALRVTKKHQQAVTNHKGNQRFKVLAIKKMECIFTTPELERLNKQLQGAIAEYERASEQLVKKAMSVASTYSPVMDRIGDVLGDLDVLAAFARVAATAPCTFVRARVEPTCKTFAIRGATHVLVVANSEKGFVANNLSMDKDSSRLHLITGPNMGGKSTYIRSVALIALLNQIGSFVPCESAVLPVFDAIMCRVGASDMQLRGISTFMAEMLEAACILNTATERSLVIVDELGRGTSTSDGFGIAWAIARHLAEEKRCFSLFATHFHELAALEDAVPGVRNRHATAAVDAASGQLTFLYSLADGAADQSYGAHVAELAGFPTNVVEAARHRAEEFEAGSGFGRAAKRQRTGEAASEPLAYVLAARDEEEFVARSLERRDQLQALVRCN
uniref:DNA mismatch repair protein MSH2 n=1 Tax=Lingulaulax polyedra TaxID=160621 RepID=A0A516AGH6_LINPO|nr:DNA mismatch repair protein MSH2 [Lingulodinium polyedra]